MINKFHFLLTIPISLLIAITIITIINHTTTTTTILMKLLLHDNRLHQPHSQLYSIFNYFVLHI